MPINSRLRAFRADRPSLDEEPKFFSQTPDDLDEDRELSKRPGPTGILRALLRLIRRSAAQDRSIVCTYGDIAREAGVTERTVKTHVKRLIRRHYLERETLPGPRGFAARKTQFRVTYDLRPGFMLEADPPVVTGSPMGKKTSPPMGKKTSPGPLFDRACDQRYTTEEIHDDDASSKSVVVVSSDSTGKLNPNFCPIVERIRALWPDEPLIERRAAELAAPLGMAAALLAIEYAERRPSPRGSGLAYGVSTVNRWHCSGYDLAECEEEVSARRPKPKPVPSPRQPEPAPAPPTPDEIRSAIENVNEAEHPVTKRIFQGLIRRWLDDGLVPEDLIPAAEKAGRGSSRQLAPRPAGTFDSVSSDPGKHPNPIVKGCACQEAEKNSAIGQCPPGDSNPERTD